MNKIIIIAAFILSFIAIAIAQTTTVIGPGNSGLAGSAVSTVLGPNGSMMGGATPLGPSPTLVASSGPPPTCLGVIDLSLGCALPMLGGL